MKRPAFRLFAISISIIIIFTVTKPAILFFAKKQLKAIFPGANVYVGNCSLRLLDYLGFFNVEINKAGAYSIKAKETGIYYNLTSILDKGVVRISLKDLSIDVTDEKFQLNSNLDGNLSLSVKGFRVGSLNGEFSSLGAGGTFIIKDANFLKNLARNSGQPLDIVVESFKNYHYNKGNLKVTLEKGNLFLDIALDGENGRRDINIVLHDFRYCQRFYEE